MQYIFENFRFDAIQQVLYKNGQVIPLKQNEAKLLSLFLSRPEDILSKDTILNEVWGDRVVSEQVVFQNMSQLRTIFSDKSIKTFPKKGYKWQLEIQPEAPTEISASKELREEKFPEGLRTSTKLWSVLGSLIVLILFFLSVKEQPKQTVTTHVIRTHITTIPFENSDDDSDIQVANALNQALKVNLKNEQFRLNWSERNISTRAFFNAPLLTMKDTQLGGRDLLLSGFVSPQNDGLLLRYHLQGINRAWVGYLFTSSVETLVQQLNIKLNRILSSQYLALEYDALVTSELTLLHNRHPDDHEILLRLIERQIAQKDYDIAMALVDKLIDQSDPKQHTAYLGSGNMLKGKIFHLRNALDSAEQFYRQAHEILATRNLLLLQSKVSKSEGWLGYFRKDYRQVKASLYQAASQAKLADEPLAEIEAYTLQSILASKMGYEKEKYDHLYKAKSLLFDYQLDKANFAVIYYHFALFAESKEEKTSYFKKILALPYKQENSWILEDSQEHLAQYYIAQQNWQEALGLFSDRQNSAFSNNQRAQIYFAMDDQAKVLDYAKQAFSQAIIHYNHVEGLNAALLLYRISIQTSDIAGEIEYRGYIEKNAFKQWLDRRHDVLKALGYFKIQDKR